MNTKLIASYHFKFLFMVLAYILSISSSFALPVIKSELAGVSCMLIQDKGPSNQETGSIGFCSGTFVAANVFVTAAHCVSDLDRIGNISKAKRPLRVACPGNKYFKVHASFPNPSYFKGAPRIATTSGVHLLDNKGDYFFDFDDRGFIEDIAVLITETNFQRAYPKVSNSGHASYRDCRFLGYSPYICNRNTGEGCERSLSIKGIKDSFVKSIFSFDLEYDSYSKTLGKTNKGDSGGGLVCKNKNKLEVVAVNVGFVKSRELVNIARHSKFISQFLNRSVTDLLKQSERFTAYPLARSNFSFERIVNELTKESGLKFSCSGFSRTEKDVRECSNFWQKALVITKDRTLMSKLKVAGIKELVGVYSGDLDSDYINKSGVWYVHPSTIAEDLINRIMRF